MVIAAELEARDGPFGQSVVPALLDLEVEDGERLRLEAVGLRWLQPRQDLPFGDGDRRQLWDQGAGPAPHRDHEAPGLVAAAIGANPDAVLEWPPLQDPLAPVELRTVRQGLSHVSQDAFFGRQEPAVRLEHDPSLRR